METLEKIEAETENAIEPREDGCAVPLVPMQFRWWRNVVNNWKQSIRIPAVAVRISGPLNVSILRQSLIELVRRHETLRTRIVVADDAPWQQIDSPGAFELVITDLSHLAAAEAEVETNCLAQAFAHERVDLALGPLFAAKLLCLPGGEHVLLLGIDHAVADMMSCGILTGEMWALYNQGVRGRALSLPDPKVQFADFAVWLERNYASWLAKHGHYWRRKLTNTPQTEIPADEGAIEAVQPIGAEFRMPLGKEISDKLRGIARKEKTLLPLVLLALFAAAMSPWCDRKDLVIQLMINGRDRHEMQSVIGLFVSSLYMRVQIGEGDSLHDLVRRMHQEYTEAYTHRDYGQVLNFLPECRTDLFFNWLPAKPVDKSTDRVSAGDQLTLEPVPLKFAWPVKFHAFFSDVQGGIELAVHYRPDLFSAGTLEKFGQRIQRFAGELIERPHSLVVRAINEV